MDKYFTIYWRNGTRNFVIGESIEQAFNKHWGGGAINAVDFYEEGVTESHYWDKEKHEWVKYEPINIHADDVVAFGAQLLEELLLKHRTLNIQFDSKDELSVHLGYGDFSTIGVVKYIEIVYGEYYSGSYGGETDEGHHFMAMGTEYFRPENTALAIEALMKRLQTTPYKVAGMGTPLEDIKASQPEIPM